MSHGNIFKQESQLQQTDRATAFCVTEIWREIFPSSSLITMQNVVVVYHNVWVFV